MKYYRILFLAAALTGLASCAVDPLKEYEVEKPQSIAQYEYLNEYDVLKNYVNRSASPDFKLGAALAVSDFTAKTQVYALASSNFDEMTAGNAMKYASVVDDKGNMNFDNVRSFVTTAEEAGMTVYGHTLAWHAQQNNKYLNNLIADKEIEIDPDATNTVVDAEFDYTTMTGWWYWAGKPDAATVGIVDGVFQSYNPEVIPNFWEFQYHVADGIQWAEGVSYKITMMIRASEATSFTLTAGTWGTQAAGSVEVGTEWQEVTVSRMPNVTGGGFVMFQSGNFAGTIEMKSLKVTHEEAMAVSWWTPIISNGDAEGDDRTNFVSTHVGATNGPADIVDGAGVDGTRAFVVTSAGGGVNSWDTQFFLYTERKLVEGDKVKLEFDYRADVANNSESQAHGTPGGYIHWDGGAAVSFTTDWQHFSKTITINSTVSPDGNMQTFAWNLDVGAPSAPVNKYYFDNIQLSIEESGNTIPQTPEEKKDTLTWAMDNWIKGMMMATEGKVVAWDAVNEAISGADVDGDGKYDLQSAATSTDPANNFYWQDYLGNEDYVRIVVDKARKYFAEAGGDPSALKLFINDYNLESDWDDNKKLKSLIEWIKVWESDGKTKIDGIGTQMHVSYYEKPETQKSKEDHVVKMLELLADSGKLVKISELDMGYVDASGNAVATVNMTEDQHAAMANYYKFIVSKYLEIIPAAQQYGITQWCLTDASGEIGTGWRGGEPVGLWDQSFNRKHTYAGFAAGLGGTPSAE
ncbi:MAG: endo-1,4-beta-xylanase [Bacteroidales bacterium]|nr:endo-1,4-beta-xylanase [Bacteroidales bacterium]